MNRKHEKIMQVMNALNYAQGRAIVNYLYSWAFKYGTHRKDTWSTSFAGVAHECALRKIENMNETIRLMKVFAGVFAFCWGVWAINSCHIDQVGFWLVMSLIASTLLTTLTGSLFPSTDKEENRRFISDKQPALSEIYITYDRLYELGVFVFTGHMGDLTTISSLEDLCFARLKFLAQENAKALGNMHAPNHQPTMRALVDLMIQLRLTDKSAKEVYAQAYTEEPPTTDSLPPESEGDTK